MERLFTCPYCWETISMVLDTSVESQVFIEDCEVCCHPLQISYRVEGVSVIEFNVERA